MMLNPVKFDRLKFYIIIMCINKLKKNNYFTKKYLNTLKDNIRIIDL